jgi:hypothetical protein
MKRKIEGHQRGMTIIPILIDGSDVNGGTLTTNGIDAGANQVKISETGNGEYTITLNEPGSRACRAVATPITDNSIMNIVSTTASTVLVKQETASTGNALADGDFELWIIKFDSADET